MSIQDISAIVIAIATVTNVIVTIYLANATKLAAREAKEATEATKQTAEATIAAVESANKQLEMTKSNSRGDFLLRLDEAFQHHGEVREKLADGGDWHKKKNDPNYPKGPDFDISKDLIDVSNYMGLFERIKVLVDEGIIDIDLVDRLYSSRFFNIVRNPIIYQKRLVAHTNQWKEFIELWKALVEARQASNYQLPNNLPSLDSLLSRLSQS